MVFLLGIFRQRRNCDCRIWTELLFRLIFSSSSPFCFNYRAVGLRGQLEKGNSLLSIRDGSDRRLVLSEKILNLFLLSAFVIGKTKEQIFLFSQEFRRLQFPNYRNNGRECNINGCRWCSWEIEEQDSCSCKHLRDCNLFPREQTDNFDPRMKPKENVSVVYRGIRKTVIYPLNREIDHFDQDKWTKRLFFRENELCL